MAIDACPINIHGRRRSEFVIAHRTTILITTYVNAKNPTDDIPDRCFLPFASRKPECNKPPVRSDMTLIFTIIN